jgi:regulator of sirC expression with transglutaminase-like and TPR domain
MDDEGDARTARFAELARLPEPELAGALDEAVLLVGAHARPGVDVAAYLGRLDELAEGCEVPTLSGLVHQLFVVEGFAGNRSHYYDPRNSYLHEVLDRRLGIPITLAVVMLSVGRRLGVPLAGVGLPGHFLVRHEDDPPALLDPFAGGAELTLADCEARFRAARGDAPFDPSLLATVGPHAVLARVLANLQHVFDAGGDQRSLEWVLRLRATLPDAGVAEHAAWAGALASLGRFPEAADALEAGAVALAVDAEAAQKLEARARALRARLN